jgi:FAD/FMN-containing dehydrogenase
MAELAADVRDLSTSFSGRLLLPADAGYDEARRVHNGLIDRRPALIAQCRGTADISAAVNLAREHGLRVTIRGGGHNVAGRAVNDGGLMIDLSLMRSVVVDSALRTARVEGGATWKEVNRETQHFGLATTGGVVGTTGVAGLTLGGGFGWTMPKHGMALDNLKSVDIVLADGAVVRANEAEHSDLFWAIRGAGANFGVVASFEFRLHAIGPMVSGGLVAWPIAAAPDVLGFFRDFTRHLDDDVFAVGALVTGPDATTKLVAIAAGYMGPAESAEAALAPIKSFGSPVLDAMGPIPYVALNGMLDAGFPKGGLNYWKSHFFESLDDTIIDAAITAMASCPSPMSQILFENFHGAAMRIATDATAYALRRPGFNALILGEWMDTPMNDVNIGWVKDTYAALQPFGSDRRYANYMGDDDMSDAGLVAVYGPNLRKLREVKKKYDPDNFFRENLNITLTDGNDRERSGTIGNDRERSGTTGTIGNDRERSGTIGNDGDGETRANRFQP